MTRKPSQWRKLGMLALFLPLAGCQSGPVVTTFDGYYAGDAINITDGVFNCPPTQTTAPIRVSGGEVSYGDFHGRVTPEGTVEMHSWRDGMTGSVKNTVSGRFGKNQFGDGEFIGDLKLTQPGDKPFVCTYRLTLSRR